MKRMFFFLFCLGFGLFPFLFFFLFLPNPCLRFYRLLMAGPDSRDHKNDQCQNKHHPRNYNSSLPDQSPAPLLLLNLSAPCGFPSFFFFCQ